ncbi:MAG: hypothetical protein JXB38_00835 [Anaerolineales bacterium]|nr:hypothetical protein [Anaerolineales bacterium]
MPDFTIASKLSCSPDELAADVFTMQGVNFELAPFVRMTAPKEWAARPIAEWPTGEVLFTSVLLLSGFIPIDRHRFMLKATSASRFEEHSSSLLMKHWGHTREIRPAESHVDVIDALSFQTRIPLLGSLLLPVYKFVFSYRHRRLRKRYGGARTL